MTRQEVPTLLLLPGAVLATQRVRVGHIALSDRCRRPVGREKKKNAMSHFWDTHHMGKETDLGKRALTPLVSSRWRHRGRDGGCLDHPYHRSQFCGRIHTSGGPRRVQRLSSHGASVHAALPLVGRTGGRACFAFEDR